MGEESFATLIGLLFNVTWVTDSIVPILEHKLLYRRSDVSRYSFELEIGVFFCNYLFRLLL